MEKRVSYGVLSISGYSDLDRLDSSVKSVHFRKFVSVKLIRQVLELVPRLKVVSFSKYALSRAGKESLELLRERGVDVKFSKRLGRPSLIEMVVL